MGNRDAIKLLLNFIKEGRIMKFVFCKHCKNMAGVINDSGVPMVCCGEPMTVITANTVEASKEKHIPVITYAQGHMTVNVGSIAHPMQPEHFIEFVYVQTAKGGQRKNLLPGASPLVEFAFTDDEPVTVFAYCNLHGLWATVI